MGVATERHDLMSQETHAATWISFRQPVMRTLKQRQGEDVEWTWHVNPGEVWEEDEFWIALSWRIDPDGSLGVRKYFESPYRPGECVTIDEYYRWIFENSVPGLPAAAAAEGMSPLEYMRRHGAFLVKDEIYRTHETELEPQHLEGTETDEATQTVRRGDALVAPLVHGKARTGFPTLSKRMEIHSQTMADWGWPEQTLPAATSSSQVHLEQARHAGRNEFALLLPTFRLPTLIHTRSGERQVADRRSANTNPLWVHPSRTARAPRHRERRAWCASARGSATT